MTAASDDSAATSEGAPPWLAVPRGGRDLLPTQCRRRRALTATLLDEFESWGYEPVATPAMEFFDVLARGLSEADRRGSVRFIGADHGELVTLRADVTPQIARMLAQRWGGELASDVAHRFCYAAEVLRQPTEAREQTEVHQVGIEFIGDDDPAADAELIALADASLRAAGLQDFRIDLAHTAVARGLLDGLGLPEDARQQAQVALARKDRGGVASVLAQHDTPSAVATAVESLADLFGPPQSVLPRALAALAGTEAEAALRKLSAALEHLPALTRDGASRVMLDLGEARGFDYYSGIRLRVWAPGVQHPVIRGGRYDGLPRRFGVPRPATGLAVDLDALEVALAQQGDAPADVPRRPGHLVATSVATGDATLRARGQMVAHRAREQGRRAWVQPGIDLARAQQLADAASADCLTFIDEHGDHQWSRGPQGWAQAQENA